MPKTSPSTRATVKASMVEIENRSRGPITIELSADEAGEPRSLELGDPYDERQGREMQIPATVQMPASTWDLYVAGQGKFIQGLIDSKQLRVTPLAV